MGISLEKGAPEKNGRLVDAEDPEAHRSIERLDPAPMLSCNATDSLLHSVISAALRASLKWGTSKLNAPGRRITDRILTPLNLT